MTDSEWLRGIVEGGWNGDICPPDVKALFARVADEQDALRERCRRAEDARDSMADAVLCLRRLGHLSGCDHVATADDRARLVRCIEERVEELEDEVAKFHAYARANGLAWMDTTGAQ